MSDYDLLVEFPDQSASFAHGFEAGQLYAMMKTLQAKIEQVINEENVEFIAQLATRCGYTATFREVSNGWAEMVLSPPKESGPDHL